MFSSPGAVAIHIGPLAIRWYGVLIAGAVLLGTLLAQREAARVEALPVQHPHAAGIDIGSRSHWVCAGFATDAASYLIREFPAHTAGLKAIAAFLREHHVDSVAMESTGVYWIPLYELLQSEGLEALLVNPAYTHQLRAFVAAVRNHTPTPTDPANAIANMEVIDAVYQKAGLPLRGKA